MNLQNYHSAKNEYRKCCDQKKRSYNTNINEEIKHAATHGDCKTFWNTVKKAMH